MIYFLCSVLLTIVCCFMLFPLAIVLSDFLFDIFRYFLLQKFHSCNNTVVMV